MRNLWRQMQLMKYYFIASALVFAVGVVMGVGFADQFQAFIDEQLAGLRQLTESIENQPNPQMTLFWLIFLNNTSKSILIIALGAFFGILPLFFLLSNGLLLGYVGVAATKKVSLAHFLAGILPHGVIEIPAIIFACAFGLRFGVLILKTMIGAIRPGGLVAKKEQLRDFTKALGPAVLVLVISLGIAAVIESTITYWLVAPEPAA
ncbi:stage II sporulation protein M [Paenibacillus xerothermodurans]|uniref:Stage II sporulation protein M n=1 Tax=Paenibacillus xerothermodurans TaxID=1977292 RepID=A0A2W1NTV8_PAEXE|nr:stage II sporulation protein M [Paenibacillus xerothermodurans]PZE19102.1 stage II sporulation protein M [Paenibacillus xerothermodurans]